MNLQTILEPIADFLVATFEMVLVPMSEPFNWICIVLGVLGLVYWMITQKRLNAKAEREGNLK